MNGYTPSALVEVVQEKCSLIQKNPHLYLVRIVDKRRFQIGSMIWVRTHDPMKMNLKFLVISAQNSQVTIQACFSSSC